MLTLSEGNLKLLNELAVQARADFIIHTGDFGFYDEESLKRIADKLVYTFHHKQNRTDSFAER